MIRSYIEIINLLGIEVMDNPSMLEVIKKSVPYKNNRFSKGKEVDKQLLLEDPEPILLKQIDGMTKDNVLTLGLDF